MYCTIFLALVSADFGAFWRILADFGVKTQIMSFILLLVNSSLMPSLMPSQMVGETARGTL
jgi:hypothetical protein